MPIIFQYSGFGKGTPLPGLEGVLRKHEVFSSKGEVVPPSEQENMLHFTPISTVKTERSEFSYLSLHLLFRVIK